MKDKKQYLDYWDKKELVNKNEKLQLEKDKKDISKLWNIDFENTLQQK